MSSNVPSVLPRKLRLPRDASIQYTDYPPQLYLNMTITKVEHIQALAGRCGLAVIEDNAMPANNRLLVFRKEN